MAHLRVRLPSLFLSQSSRHTNVLRHAPRTQDEKLPLHYAAAKGAPLDVMKLLLEANRDAATAVAQARRRAHARHSRGRWRCGATHRIWRASSLPCPVVLSKPRRVHGASQDGKQPLHYAVAKGVPLDVTQLLLEGNRQAAATADKARGSALHRPCCRGRSMCPSLPWSWLSQSPAARPVLCATRLAYAGGKAAPASRCRQGRTVRRDEAAARRQSPGRHRSG